MGEKLNGHRQIYVDEAFETLMLTLQDDSMGPRYRKGDDVRGEVIDPLRYVQALGKECLVEVEEIGLLLRVFQYGTSRKEYSLRALNFKSKAKHLFIRNPKIQALAPLNYHHRPLLDNPMDKSWIKDA